MQAKWDFGAHPDYENPGIEGLQVHLAMVWVYVEMAYAENLKSKSNIYSVLSDGECQKAQHGR